MKARLERFRQKCDADPAACARKKEALRQKADALAAECADDPASCEQKKNALRERLEQKKRANPPAGETPPIVPPVPQQ